MRLIQAIDAVTAADLGCSTPNCLHEPSYRVATPLGHLDYCDPCIDGAVASLPAEWLAGFGAVPIEPPPILGGTE